ncbi:zinc ribbon domain-containing protein [Bacillus sp. 1P06AnD]|uniref:zinc ribbon domain-containing protein n=1 Tax=Bacillus sp. 1P06AnD TaxID=3132208 RepID=UPI0039A23A0C
MRYCKECGHPLKPEAQFCGECGAPVSEKSAVDSAGRQAEKAEIVSTKKPMTKKQKTAWIAGIAAVVVLFALYKVGDYFFSEEYAINHFEDALVAKDGKKVAKWLSTDDKKLTINEKSVKGFITYYKENPEQVNETVQALKRQAEEMDKQSNASSAAYGDYSSGMVHLVKDGKFLFYDKYKLKVQPVYMAISTNYKDTSVYVDGKKMTVTKQPNAENTVGPFVPGTHIVEAKLKTSFVDLVKKEKVVSGGAEKEAVELYLDGEEVYVDLDMGDEDVPAAGKLYINGKDVQINPFQNASFGPVLTDGSMTAAVEADMPWGKMKSAETAIDSDSIQINLGSDAAFQKTVMDTVVLNNKEWLTAYTTGDTSKVTTGTEDLRSTIKDNIEQAKSANEYYKAKYTGTTFDLDSFRLYTYDGKYYSDVKMLENKQSDSYYADETPELEENDDAYEVTLVYDANAKKWLVDSFDSSYMESENTKLIKEDAPLEYATSWNKNVQVSSSGAENVPDAISSLIDGYTSSLIDAINYDDFSYVSSYLKEGSELYGMQEKLVDTLNANGTTEEKISCDIKGYSIDGNKASITTYEKVKIDYSNGKSETKEYTWMYGAEKTDSGFLLTSIKAN